MSESGTSSNTKHSLSSSSFSCYGCVRCRKIIHCYRHEEGPHYVSWNACVVISLLMYGGQGSRMQAHLSIRRYV